MRDCEGCRHYLKAGAKTEDGRSWGIDVCRHPRVNGGHIFAIKLARAWDGKCGPDGRGWKPRSSE